MTEMHMESALLKFRHEGTMYVASVQTTDENNKLSEFVVGVISSRVIKENDKIREAFIALMRDSIRHMLTFNEPGASVSFIEGASLTEKKH